MESYRRWKWLHMNKLYVFLVLGILMLGIASSTFILFDKKGFTKKVDKISYKLLCDKKDSEVYDKEICKDLKKGLKVKETIITQNEKGVYKIENE